MSARQATRLRGAPMQVMTAPIKEAAMLVRREAGDLLVIRADLVVDAEALKVLQKELKPV